MNFNQSNTNRNFLATKQIIFIINANFNTSCSINIANTYKQISIKIHNIFKNIYNLKLPNISLLNFRREFNLALKRNVNVRYRT